MYPYHNKIKQRINNGELVDYYYDTRKNIGECLVLVFNTIPFERPIRPHRFEMYQPILEKWEKEQNSKNEEKGENDMNNLQIKKEDKVLTSLEVSEMVGKEHHKLLRDIRTYVEQLDQSKIGYVDFFLESTYLDKKGEERPCYLITKKGCEFIANKLTGKKGTIFTATYINRFNEMEQVIKENIVPPNNLEEMKVKAQLERAEAMKLNAKTRMFNSLMKSINGKKISPIAVEVFGLRAIEEVTGVDTGQYLPQVPKTYSATDIGQILGVSSQKIGGLAIKHNLKTEENGIWVMDKSKYSSKEVSTFRYYENAINIFRKLLA